MIPRRAPTICFFTAVPATLEMFVEPIASEARSRGYRTIAVTGGMPGDMVACATAFDALEFVPPFRRRGPAAQARAIARLVRILRSRDVDLMHVHTPFAVALGRIAATATRTRSIAVVHGTMLDGRSARDTAFRAVESATARLTRHYITVNDEDAEWYRRVAPSASIRVAPCGGAGVDMAGFQGALASGRRSAADPVALVLGRLTPEKNPDLAVAAWAAARREVPNLRLRFVGSALDGDVAWQPPREAGIEHVPWTSNPATELASAAVLLACSSREGFPMAVTEALIADLPVVAVSNRGTRMIARDVAPSLLQLAEPQAEAVGAALVRAVRSAAPGALPLHLRERWDRKTVVEFHIREIERVGGFHPTARRPGNDD